MAATVPGSSTIGVSHEKKQGFRRVLGIMPEQNDKELYALFRADALNRFYVPAVMAGHQEPAPPTARTVHILGHDERSKYLSHSLHGVYDSVKMVSPLRNSKYRNASGNWGRKSARGGWIEPNAAEAERRAEGRGREVDEGHISNLIVAGPASHAVKLLDQVKHRVDDRTAVCFMQDGLGIAEAANNNVFQDPETRPSMILGHMGHTLARDRKRSSIVAMKGDQETFLTGIRPYVRPTAREAHKAEFRELTPSNETWLRTQGMLSQFAQARRLRATGVPLDNWLSVKIPSLMFASVADPICVMLDYRYEQLIHNPTANRLIDQLLNEIADVVAGMPEVRHSSPQLQELLRSEGMRKLTLAQMRGKKDAPCKMVQQIRHGQLTDINYLNGYFMRRGKKMGIHMPANEMLVGLVKAKHKAEVDKLRGYIPMEMSGDTGY